MQSHPPKIIASCGMIPQQLYLGNIQLNVRGPDGCLVGLVDRKIYYHELKTHPDVFGPCLPRSVIGSGC